MLGRLELSLKRFKKWETAIKNRPEEGVWLFHGQKMLMLMRCRLTHEPKASRTTLTTWLTSFILAAKRLCPGCLALLALLRHQLERLWICKICSLIQFSEWLSVELNGRDFCSCLQAGFDPVKAQVRLNWGSPESPEITAADLISAATSYLALLLDQTITLQLETQ